MSSIDHYENFPVASWLCPAHLRPGVFALYQFARTADDFADEGEEPAHHRLELLGEYRADLQNCFDSPNVKSVRWPRVFGPLAWAVEHYQLPKQPLLNLLDAFEQDVIYTSVGQGYRNRDELLNYCNRSANPVGRLMLHLYGVNTPKANAQSDSICSALQLINFWQDRAEDLRRGRDYLPHGHTLGEELIYARELMLKGAPLVHDIGGLAGWELRTVIQGGLCILDKLETRHETKNHMQLARPRLHKLDLIRMLWRGIGM